MSAATTRFDAPLLLGRVVKHPMMIENTFDAVPFDRGIREYDAMTPSQVEELFLAIEATPIEALNSSVSDEFHDRVNQVHLQELEAVASTKDPAAENHVSYRDATSSIEM